MMKKTYQKALHLFFLLLLTNGVGYIGSTFMTPDNMLWYQYLNKPLLTPPNIVFPIMWTILFFMMAIAAFLVWNKANPKYFTLSLMANLAWSFSFFYLRNTLAALVIILIYLFLLYMCIKVFYKASRMAAYLMIPTFIWCLFALYLNGYVVLFN